MTGAGIERKKPRALESERRTREKKKFWRYEDPTSMSTCEHSRIWHYLSALDPLLGSSRRLRCEELQIPLLVPPPWSPLQIAICRFPSFFLLQSCDGRMLHFTWKCGRKNKSEYFVLPGICQPLPKDRLIPRLRQSGICQLSYCRLILWCFVLRKSAQSNVPLEAEMTGNKSLNIFY